MFRHFQIEMMLLDILKVSSLNDDDNGAGEEVRDYVLKVSIL